MSNADAKALASKANSGLSILPLENDITKKTQDIPNFIQGEDGFVLESADQTRRTIIWNKNAYACFFQERNSEEGEWKTTMFDIDSGAYNAANNKKQEFKEFSGEHNSKDKTGSIVHDGSCMAQCLAVAVAHTSDNDNDKKVFYDVNKNENKVKDAINDHKHNNLVGLISTYKLKELLSNNFKNYITVIGSKEKADELEKLSKDADDYKKQPAGKERFNLKRQKNS